LFGGAPRHVGPASSAGLYSLAALGLLTDFGIEETFIARLVLGAIAFALAFAHAATRLFTFALALSFAFAVEFIVSLALAAFAQAVLRLGDFIHHLVNHFQVVEFPLHLFHFLSQ